LPTPVGPIQVWPMGELALDLVRLDWECDLLGKLGDGRKLVLANFHWVKDHGIKKLPFFYRFQGSQVKRCALTRVYF